MTEQEMKEKEVTEEELQNNKAIEQAYKAEMQTEIPDLWDRIEAALPEKTPSVKTETADSGNQGSINDASKKTKKKSNIRTFRTIALIAACLCVALMIPTLLSIGGHRSETAASASLDEEEYAASSETAAEPEATESVPAEDTAAEAESAAEDVDRSNNAAEDFASEATAVTEATADAAATKEESVQASEEKSAALERNDFGSDALYTENVEIEIIECDTATGREDDDGYCTFTVMILEDETGIYESASIMDVYVDESEAQSIKAGEKLTVTLVNPDPLSSGQLKICMFIQD